jgi:hypothetical protein
VPRIDVRYCVVCEDCRIEVHNKLTVLGMFGLAPDAAEVAIQDITKPLNRLTFILWIWPTQTDIKKFGFSLVHEDGTEIVTGPPTDTPFDFSTKGIAILQVQSPTFKKAGTVTLSLAGDGEEIYRTSFAVLQGKPETFST